MLHIKNISVTVFIMIMKDSRGCNTKRDSSVVNVLLLAFISFWRFLSMFRLFRCRFKSFVLIHLDETPWRCYGRIRHLGNVNLNPQNLSLALNENQLQSGIVLQKSKHSGYKLEVVLLEYYIWFFFSGNPENHLDGDVQYVGSVAHTYTYMRLYFSK